MGDLCWFGIELVIISTVAHVIHGTSPPSTYVTEPNTVSLSEAFFIQIERDWFKDFFPAEDEVQFSASLLDMPDLPNWMFCRHPNGSRNAFLYGAAQELGSMDIEIIALNRNNYNTALKVMKINVEPRDDVANFEVEMKFLNLNVEDMFKAGRLSRLVEVYRNILWRESDLLYVTKVVSSLDVGGRLPLNPNEKEGVVVRIGGNTEFSRTLQDLEREVQPLRNRFPCPRDYKRTSAEHLFRKRNFITDWCSFRLISNKVDSAAGSTRELSNPTYTTALLHDEFKPQSINIPRRDFLFDFIVSIIVPSTVVGILSTALTCIMCCNKDGFEKKLGSDGNVQLGQYSVHCSANENDNTYAERNSVQGSGYAGASSLPRSTGGSPNSTLHKSCTLRSNSRTSTLRGNMLPPPPPYTPPPNAGSKRSATSTLTR